MQTNDNEFCMFTKPGHGKKKENCMKNTLIHAETQIGILYSMKMTKH